MIFHHSVSLFFLFSLTLSQEISTIGPCVDDPTTDCQDYATLCKNKMYEPFLDVFCPKTCGLCPGDTTINPVTASPNCVDTNINCKSWVKEGYCTACFVDCSDRIKNCAKSCGFCVEGSCLNCKPRQKFVKLTSSNC
uniref:ShKT domain-containing protein n=2 Tax=Caenorhabditis tropicalis TaxID=1561998 RepID=A0A1I7UUJ4_9PELO